MREVRRRRTGTAAETVHDRDALAEGAAWILRAARRKFRISPSRAETMLRVARTIADLAGAMRIEAPHLADALSYEGGEVVGWRHDRS